MFAEKLTLRTDSQGKLTGLPMLPPDEEIEVILLRKEHSLRQTRRMPPAELAWQGAQLHGDDIGPIIPDSDWNMLAEDIEDAK
jgi:hypothetical protein